MQPETVDGQLSTLLDPALLVILIFVVPGVVAVQVYRILVPTEQPGFTGTVTAFVTYGALTLVIWSWLLAFVNPVRFVLERPLGSVVLLLVILFVTPALLAYGWRRVLSTSFVDGLISKVRSQPTGWDAFFSRGDSCYILFHLKSGDKVGGLYEEASDASIFPNTQQVYIEQFWRLDEDLNFVEPVPQSYGGIINRADCDFVEFFEISGDDSGDDQQDQPEADGRDGDEQEQE